MTGYVKIRRAVISVFDKFGIASFAKALVEMGVEIISTGGTAKELKGAGVPVIEIEDITGFPEMLDGRVKTLHPKIHGGLLYIRGNVQHEATVSFHDIEPIDMVVVNLYPFEKTIAKPDCAFADAIENIDIGGPAMLRSAAKNHASVTAIVNPADYNDVLVEMRLNHGHVSQETRSRLAARVFSETSAYDSAIANYLNEQQGVKFPNILTRAWRKSMDFRYGENPHQEAALYRGADISEPTVAHAKLLPGGKGFSYNNCDDTNAALELVKEFADPTVAVIKHQNPAGCSSDENIVEAYRKAYLADPSAAMGGIIAVNRLVTPELAVAIVESYKLWGKDAGAGGFFAEVIIASAFDADAVRIIRGKAGWGSEVRLIEAGTLTTGARNCELSCKSIPGGVLVQDRDLLGLEDSEQWKVVTNRKPDLYKMEDLRFAWLVCKHCKSNAIVLANDKTLLGAGVGQMSRVNSAMMATMLAKHYGGDEDHDNFGCVVASDAFLPFPDNLEWAEKARATAVVQPGGSKKDGEVIARANELDLAMVFTGARHFKH